MRVDYVRVYTTSYAHAWTIDPVVRNVPAMQTLDELRDVRREARHPLASSI